MNIRNYVGFSLTKGLLVLFMALQISGCSLDDYNEGIILGTVTINWTAPVARADGEPLLLSEIGGYHVYYGTTAGYYPDRLTITDGTAEQATMTVPIGVYYYVKTTYDTDGRESVFSAENIITSEEMGT